MFGSSSFIEFSFSFSYMKFALSQHNTQAQLIRRVLSTVEPRVCTWLQKHGFTGRWRTTTERLTTYSYSHWSTLCFTSTNGQSKITFFQGEMSDLRCCCPKHLLHFSITRTQTVKLQLRQWILENSYNSITHQFTSTIEIDRSQL